MKEEFEKLGFKRSELYIGLMKEYYSFCAGIKIYADSNYALTVIVFDEFNFVESESFLMHDLTIDFIQKFDALFS